MKHIVMAAIAALMLAMPMSVTSAQELSLEQIQKAACRITAYDIGDNGQREVRRGSGTFVKDDNGIYRILTNGHVVRRSEQVYIEVFDEGWKSGMIPVDVDFVTYYQNSSLDMSVLSVPKHRLGAYVPTMIPLARGDAPLRAGNVIYGAGCPSGKWMQAWKGAITAARENIIQFNAAPEGGQSGSAILKTINGNTRVVGIVTWRIADTENEFGAGLNIRRIEDIIIGNPQVDRVSHKYCCIAERSEAIDADKICTRCGARKGDHPLRNGLYHCPTCRHHGKTLNEHDEAQCGPNGCFPQYPQRRQPYQQPYTPPADPYQRQRLPPNLFPDRIEDPDRMPPPITGPNPPRGEPIPRDPDEPNVPPVPPEPPGHYLDAATNGNGNTVENVSLTLIGATLGATAWSTLIYPWLIKRTGRVPAWIISKIGKRGLARLAKKHGLKKNDAAASDEPIVRGEKPTSILSPDAPYGLPPFVSDNSNTSRPNPALNLSAPIQGVEVKPGKFPITSESFEPIKPPTAVSEIGIIGEAMKPMVQEILHKHGGEIKVTADEFLHKMIGAIEQKFSSANPVVSPQPAPIVVPTQPTPEEIVPGAITLPNPPVAATYTPESTTGLDRGRININAPFQRNAPTSDQIMGILGDLAKEYQNDKGMTADQLRTLVLQRLQVKYGVE